jgi:hypothetical protein
LFVAFAPTPNSSNRPRRSSCNFTISLVSESLITWIGLAVAGKSQVTVVYDNACSQQRPELACSCMPTGQVNPNEVRAEEYSFAKDKLPKALSYPLKRSLLDAALRSHSVYGSVVRGLFSPPVWKNRTDCPLLS